MKVKQFIVACVVIIPLILACGWDFDTIAMEKKKFPNLHELIVGKFLRHSQEFYHWRIIDRKLQLHNSPDSLQLYDDLGVAYDKTGQHEMAIRTMRIKDSIKPGLYETYANIGTFYIHNGEFKTGVAFIEKAIKINPDAHFGREIYQKHLVYYVIEKIDTNKTLSLPLAAKNRSNNFYHYLKKHQFNGKPSEKELAKAIKGIAGMMHFGQYRHPVLLEVLADLLLETASYGGSGHLGSRAYLKASFESKDEKIAKAYWNKAKKARENGYNVDHPESILKKLYHNVKLSKEEESRRRRARKNWSYPFSKMKYLEAALKYEIQSAEIWFESVRKNELNWIKSKVDVDSAFAVTYYDPGKVKYVHPKTTFTKNLVDEQKWLERQLRRPDSITYKLHNFELLSDSIVKEIRLLYKEEFEALKVLNKKQKDSLLKTTNTPETEISKWAIWCICIGTFGLLSLLLLLKFRKRKNSNK